jgi:cell division initiation protein
VPGDRKDTAVKRQSPAAIRSEVFGHRMRGLDEDEVRDYLEILADQVEAMDAELDRRRREIDELRAETHRLLEQAERAAEVEPQTEAVIGQAQQVADEVVEQAVLHARDLLKTARSQQRDILQSAYRAAEEAARSGSRPRPRKFATSVTAEVPDARTPDRMSPAELRSVVDVLTGKWDRGRAESEQASIYDQVWRVRGGPLDRDR